MQKILKHNLRGRNGSFNVYSALEKNVYTKEIFTVTVRKLSFKEILFVVSFTTLISTVIYVLYLTLRALNEKDYPCATEGYLSIQINFVALLTNFFD